MLDPSQAEEDTGRRKSREINHKTPCHDNLITQGK